MILPNFRESISFYWRVAIRPYRGAALVIVLFMVLTACLDTVTIGLAVPLMDVLIGSGRAAQQSGFLQIVSRWLIQWGLPATEQVLTFTVLAIACSLFLIRSACHILYRCATAAVGAKLRRTVKATLFERFLHAPYETLTQWARGTIVQRINDPADAINTTIGLLANLVSSVVQCAVMVAFMVYLSWWATLAIGLLLLGGMQGWRSFSNHRAAAHGHTLFELRGEQNKLEVDAVDGIKVVKAHLLESKIVDLEKALLRHEARPTLRLELFGQFPNLYNEVSASIIVLGLGALAFLFPSLGIRFSMLVAFLLAIRRIAPAASVVSISSISLSSLKRTLDVVEEVFYRMPQERSGGEGTPRIEAIQLDNISFSYATRSNQRVLSRVSAVLPRGTVTAIVGATGAGKSTLANLLVGFYVPQAGTIRVNGIELSRLDLTAWRKKIGYVSQDTFVFNGTILENIRLWDEVSQEEIEWAARVAQLHEFVAALPNGYDTVVGDRGLRLSGGQCQRLAIARAILRRPEVLIFDEATSALDNLTERAVYDAIQAMHEESIVLVIAHRLSTVREADQILVLESGQIVESGSHEELMEKQSVYAKLYGEDRTLKEATVS